MSEPLSTGQKIFNQRLLAEHCLVETQAQALYEELQQTYEDLQDLSLTDCIKSANAQLQYLGLEIVAISMPSEENGKKKTVRHYAMVNKFPDDIAKQAFQATVFQPASQQSYVKAVLEKLVQDGATARSTLLNLKNDLAADSKITLLTAEDALERLLEEKWLVESSSSGNRRGSNAAEIQLGPRAYCELSYLLTEEFGMDKDDLPQQIVLRL